MHGRALYFGAPYRAADGVTTDSQVLFERTGRNTGNLLIGYSLRSQLDTQIISISPEHRPKDRDYDFIAIAAANFLFSGFDFGPFADLVEEIDLPCIMVGLGAQAPSTGGFPEISPGTKRFVQAVAARCHSIGVRGAFTAEVLARIGVKNVELTGCPSFYLHSPSELSAAFARRKGQYAKVSLNASRNVMAHSANPEKMKDVERRMYQLCRSSDAQFVLQSEHEEMRILASPPEEEQGKLAGKIADTLGWTDVSNQELRECIRSKFQIHFDIDEWRASISKCGFSAGSRFHGNLIALLSGVPSHVICHDTRTKELCELGGVPHTLLQDISVDFTLADLQQATNVGKFIRTHADNYSGYRRFLDRNGIPHTLAKPESYASVG
jgi:polysaccharide pyruvyl transferase WcaK-like protein